MLTAGHACWSIIARQAGMPPISTLLLPGPGDSGAPCMVGSPTRAAKGISCFLQFPLAGYRNRPSATPIPSSTNERWVSPILIGSALVEAILTAVATAFAGALGAAMVPPVWFAAMANWHACEARPAACAGASVAA